MMRKINGRLEANELYKKVRDCIEKYSIDYKVEPNEIRDYVINNLDRFINKYGLSGIDGIKQIIIDVVDHKNNISKDRIKKKIIKEMMSSEVIKFSNFKRINESFMDVEKSGIEHEKVLSDYFNTSLGHIEQVDEVNHIYSVSDFGKNQIVVIFSKDELNKMKRKIVEDLVLEISDKNLIIEDVNGIKFSSEFSIQIGNIMEMSKLENVCEKHINDDKVISLVSTHLSNEVVFLYDLEKVEYSEIFRDHHIWKFV